MSHQERDWLDWLKRFRDRVITQRRAAEKMGITGRWFRTLLGCTEKTGEAVVVHGFRVEVSNRRSAEVIQANAVRVLNQPKWHDFGPRFASEQLAKRHGIHVSGKTTRGWLIEAVLWNSRPQKLKEAHP